MRRVFVVHGWGGTSQSNWIPWLCSELKSKGFEAHALEMPSTEDPKIDDWVEYLSDQVGKLDSDTYFVGHSMGCQAILRYLERIQSNEVAGGVLFIAGFLTIKKSAMFGENKRVLSPWVESKIDLGRVRHHVRNIVSVFSDNDPYVPLDDAKIFEKELGSKIIVIPRAGHFTMASGGYMELHLALNEIMKMAR